MRNNKGFSIVEMVVVMAIFVGLMLITSYAFENIIGKAGQQLKSAETQTAGIVGLEMLRSDLDHAGYGLPWSFSVTPATFAETTANPVTGITSSNFNEATPRAIRTGTPTGSGTILGGTSNTNPGVAYLVVKSAKVALNDTAKKWAYVNYVFTPTPPSNTSLVNSWGTDDFVTNERVITISSTFTSTGEPDKRLVMASATDYSYRMPGNPPVQPPADQSGNANTFKPGDASQLYVVYGIDPDSNLRMPYNRADFYVKKPATNLPESCNPGTGILIKGVVQHANGAILEYPLLNCVGDMQVEFELDRDGDGNISYSSTLTLPPPSVTELSAPQVRTQLKTARVYILAHEGKKDRNYAYPNDTIQVGDPARPASSGRNWSSAEMQAKFGTEWKRYRWKVYTVVGRPKNLN